MRLQEKKPLNYTVARHETIHTVFAFSLLSSFLTHLFSLTDTLSHALSLTLSHISLLMYKKRPRNRQGYERRKEEEEEVKRNRERNDRQFWGIATESVRENRWLIRCHTRTHMTRLR